MYREMLEHDTFDSYWQRSTLTEPDFKKIDIPIMATTGWFDGDQMGQLYNWNGIEKRSARSPNQYLVVGPWTHGQTFGGGSEKLGVIPLAKNAIIDNKAVHLAFFDRFLKQSTTSLNWPRVQLYVSGLNQWRSFDRFPVPTKPTRLYLSSGGKANSLNGDGSLSWQRPARQPSDRFDFDPKNPVPLNYTGPLFGTDRRDVQKRQDVLVYTSPVLEEPVEVIGRLAVELYAATDGKDTDFTAAISDVFPDGTSALLGSKPVGIIRGRYRKGREAKPSLLTPNKSELFRIDLGHLGHRFLPGHRIRVEISSSAYPMFNPNQNTGNSIATDVEWRTAKQSIFHDKSRPSALVLPVYSATNRTRAN
jgi:putative CocE/NonD family hydrolase